MEYPTPEEIRKSMDELYNLPEDVPPEMKSKIGNLRQWINELPESRLVTGAEIWHWLK
jgi:hypothetical protein